MRFSSILLGVLSVAAIAASPVEAAISTSAEHALLMEATSGQVLWAKDGFTAMPPASMSKLMTLELLFQRLKDGRVKLSDTLPVSERAWRERGGSEMFVNIGDRISVENLIRGIIIQSGNDACIVVAEALGGTVEGFVGMMNTRARQIGLKQSHFVNPDGLPQPDGQLMSAMDLAVLARHLILDYPKYYRYFGERSFVWSNIRQDNRNLILDKFPGADGLKTGHTDAAGYGVTASAVKDGQRLILVLNGLRYQNSNDWFAERYRADEAARILELAFREFRRYQIFKANEIVGEAKVWGGSAKTVPLMTAKALSITLQVESRPGLHVALSYDGPLRAPIAQGQRVGSLVVTAPDFPALSVPIYAAQDVSRAGIFGRMMMGLRALWTKD